MTELIKPRISKEEMALMRERDNKLVKGVFRCHEPSGGEIQFFFKKYRSDPVKKYHLEDGKTYELPRMVAVHLRDGCQYYRNQWLTDADGNPHIDRGKSHKRCSFESLDFADLGD